jgi:hypothetical protein
MPFHASSELLGPSLPMEPSPRCFHSPEYNPATHIALIRICACDRLPRRKQHLLHQILGVNASGMIPPTDKISSSAAPVWERFAHERGK